MHHPAVPNGLAAAALARQAHQAQAPDDGYNQIYEKDGGYYTRKANPDYITMVDRPKRGIFSNVFNKLLGDQIAKKNEGVDPYIYTAIANPYAPAEEVAVEVEPEAVEEFAEVTAKPFYGDLGKPPQPVQQPVQQPIYPQPQPGQAIYDPYTMPQGLGDVQNPLYGGVRGNY